MSMARQTRQSSRLVAQVEADLITNDQLEEPNDTSDPVALLQVIQSPLSSSSGHWALMLCLASAQAHVSSVVKSARALQRDYKKLEKENQELQASLTNAKEQLEAEAQPKRGRKGSGPTVPQLQKQVVQLKARVRELEKVWSKPANVSPN